MDVCVSLSLDSLPTATTRERVKHRQLFVFPLILCSCGLSDKALFQLRVLGHRVFRNTLSFDLGALFRKFAFGLLIFFKLILYLSLRRVEVQLIPDPVVLNCPGTGHFTKNSVNIFQHSIQNCYLHPRLWVFECW